MLKIRLSRRGKRKQPIFRVVVAEHSAPIKGKFIENLGYYKVTDKNKEMAVKEDRITYWLENGAKASDAVAKILTNNSKGDFIKKFGLDKQVEIARSRPPRAKKSEDKEGDQKAAAAPKQAEESAVVTGEAVEEVSVEKTEPAVEENKAENSEDSKKEEVSATSDEETEPTAEPKEDESEVPADKSEETSPKADEPEAEANSEK